MTTSGCEDVVEEQNPSGKPPPVEPAVQVADNNCSQILESLDDDPEPSFSPSCYEQLGYTSLKEKLPCGASVQLPPEVNSCEQSPKANNKYRALTKSPSDGDDIRWYFCKSALALDAVAGSMPSTEVVGKGEYLRFSIRDSLCLEAEFLKSEDELVSVWWEEYAECSEGPKPSLHSASTFNRSSSEFYDEAVGVPVKGGLFEVDLVTRRCFPVYWNGEHRRVLRGLWYAQSSSPDWLPLREDIAEQLEFAYRSKVWRRRTFQLSGEFAARVDFQGATPGLHALFSGEKEAWQATLNVDATGISSMFGLKGSGFKLRRGFTVSNPLQPSQDELRQQKEEEMDDYCSQVPVRHLVFMVHGIGQRLEKANLVDDVATFRQTTAALAEKHLTAYQRNQQRVLFIPCQWRRHLKLSGEAAVQDCTLDGVRALRNMIGATVHDVLYYMSPVYCQDIIDSVSSSLNRLYHKFIRRNPDYNGLISVYGHSLGSVLSYDILCHQQALASSFPIQEINSNVSVDGVPTSSVSDDDEKKKPLSTEEQLLKEDTIEEVESNGTNELMPDDAFQEELPEIKTLKEEILSLRSRIKSLEHAADCSSSIESSTKEESPKHHTPRINYTKLQFTVDTFFAVGSPLGLFLSLRNVRIGIGNGREYWDDERIEEEMPACRQMMNIFHPYDPVAYRVEPLVSKDHIKKRPVFVPYHKGGKRLHIGMQEFGEDLGARSKAIVGSIASVGSRVASAFSGGDKGKGENEDEQDEKKEERTYGSLVMERLTGSPEGRVDHMLQDATFEHQYISAISSHTNYWRDLDTALFILKHLYRDIAPEDYCPNNNNNSDKKKKKESAAVVLNGIDDDVPLTFFTKEEVAAAIATVEYS